MKRRNDAVVRAAYHATPVFISKAEGAVAEDVDGNRFIDFAGGHWLPQYRTSRARRDRCLAPPARSLPVNNLKLQRGPPDESYIAVCERLNGLVPVKGPKKTLLVNTGAEAVENAIKIARSYTKETSGHQFRGRISWARTYMAMAATSKTHPYKAGFEPFPSEVYRIPYAYCYRSPYSLTYPSCGSALRAPDRRHI